jgi:hypothetical protein
MILRQCRRRYAPEGDHAQCCRQHPAAAQHAKPQTFAAHAEHTMRPAQGRHQTPAQGAVVFECPWHPICREAGDLTESSHTWQMRHLAVPFKSVTAGSSLKPPFISGAEYLV